MEILNENRIINLPENIFEDNFLERLEILGWENVGVNDLTRKDFRDIFNFKILRNQLKLINDDITDDDIDDVFRQIRNINSLDLTELNKIGFKHFVNGFKVYNATLKITKTINIISKDINKNRYQILRQFEVFNSDGKKRIPDLVFFINGLPVVVAELKWPLANENEEDAFKQNQSLKDFKPQLWTFNVMNLISNQILTLFGSTTAPYKKMARIKNWKTKDNKDILEYLFDPTNFDYIIRVFTFFARENNKDIKYMAASHQMEAVYQSLNRLKNEENNKIGLVWHTQGSGKSLTMLMLARAIIMDKDFKSNGNPTLVIVTDRNDLDKQLFGRFLNAEEYLSNTAINISSRQDLIDKLNNKKQFGIYFTTVQKFYEDTGTLSSRDDIFVLVDEAHRSQNNIDLRLKINQADNQINSTYGYAHYMRKALPNAKIIGFTGTPLKGLERDSRDIFGSYIHEYLMNDSVDDQTTVPINYELRLTHINLNDEQLKEMNKIQDLYMKNLKPNDIHSNEKIKKLVQSVGLKNILENDQVIKSKAWDIYNHWKSRKSILHNKAMIVAYNREAAFKYYKELLKIDANLEEKLILVITESNKDNSEMRKAIIPKSNQLQVAEEFRKENSKYKIAIVVDMWLTGFDVPDLDTLYIDKFLKWHNLMQAIARVNRVYEDSTNHQIKENGLIVDYIGIWKHLSQALAQYTNSINIKDNLNFMDLNDIYKKIINILTLIEENFAPSLSSFSAFSDSDRYKFIVNVFELLLKSNDQKNRFIHLTRKLRRLSKMAYQLTTPEDKIKIGGVLWINRFLSSSDIQTDENLREALSNLKQIVDKSIVYDDSNMIFTPSKNIRSINDVSTILMSEANKLEEKHPRVAVELLKHALKADINAIEQDRPIFAEKASDRLKKIVKSLEDDENEVEKMLQLLHELAKEITNEKNKELAFEDKELQAFYEILANDDFNLYNKNSEILKEIVRSLMSEIKKQIGNSLYEDNARLQNNIKWNLRLILKNKYNYPPENAEDLSKIILDRINNRIKINENYFRSGKTRIWQ